MAVQASASGALGRGDTLGQPPQQQGEQTDPAEGGATTQVLGRRLQPMESRVGPRLDAAATRAVAAEAAPEPSVYERLGLTHTPSGCAQRPWPCCSVSCSCAGEGEAVRAHGRRVYGGGLT